MNTDQAAIARGLTADERHLLANIPADRVWRASNYYRSHESVLSASSISQSLRSKGLSETSIDATTRIIVYCLTPLGVAVRDILKRSSD